MSEDKYERRFVELEAQADAYANAQAESGYLDDYTKSLMASLMKAAEASGFSSAVLQEREARRDPVFVQHLKGKQIATERALSLRWRLTIAQMRFEHYRTQQATQRAQMNLR